MKHNKKTKEGATERIADLRPVLSQIEFAVFPTC